MGMLVKSIPTLLQEWKHDNINMYEMGKIFQVQLFIHSLEDVLTELNNLNW